MSALSLFETSSRQDPTPQGEFNLLRISRRAMATRFEIAIPQGFSDAIPAAEAALDLIDELEQQLTIYRDDSEISLINTRASRESIPVEPHLFDLLKRCTTWNAASENAFDIATGNLMKVWGFHRREGRIPTSHELQKAMAASGSRHLILDERNRSVKFRVDGLELNLGAVGKGYALDRAAELLKKDWGVESALLQAGGSSIFAVGHPPEEDRGWPIRIQHPNQDGSSLATLWLQDRGLGTSASTFQYFVYNGRKFGHVLDPRGGWPADRTASATIAASTAAEADAMSTALYILGEVEAKRVLEPRDTLSGLILPTDSSTTSHWIGSGVPQGF